MNTQAILEDLKALCEKHRIMIYADEDEPCTIIEALLTQEEAEAGCPPEQFRFDFITSETVKEW